MTIIQVAIVGFGTSGWLADNHLLLVLKNNQELSITLIESLDIPIIGVGEGTVPSIRKSLSSFGISESDFIKSCDVTFKQSIKFVNWLDRAKHGNNNFYHHLFNMQSPLGEDLTPYWLTHPREHFADLVSPQHAVCEENKGPKFITTPEYGGAGGSPHN